MRAFLFYIDDWLSSKKIKQMDAHEERGFLRLLLAEATEEDCGLPNDDQQLAILSELGSQWFHPTKSREKRLGSLTSGQKLRQCFFEREGRLYNERLLKEWENQQRVSRKRSEAGKLGGRRSGTDPPKAIAWQTDKQNETNDVCVCASACVSEIENQEAQTSFNLLPQNNSNGKDPNNLQAAWFIEFWAAYWRHKAKKHAQDVFSRVVTTREKFEMVMNSVRAQTAEMISRAPEHRPHAGTWLNGERWEDRADQEETVIPKETEQERRMRNI